MPGSEHLAALALDAATAMKLGAAPVYRARDDERNSVFQPFASTVARILIETTLRAANEA